MNCRKGERSGWGGNRVTRSGFIVARQGHQQQSGQGHARQQEPRFVDAQGEGSLFDQGTNEG